MDKLIMNELYVAVCLHFKV